jgi:phospholipase C
MESPQFRRGALFVVYDEWGGFFDHVAPPRVPDDRGNLKDHQNDWGQMGFRIPAIAISPYARRGYVNHTTLGFESILKLISYRFGLGNLNRRHRYAANIGRTFDWSRPDFTPPGLPDPPTVAARPCSAGGSGAGRAARPKPHDIVAMETSGLLDRLGYEVPEARYERIFRNPDSFRQALAAADG